MERIEIFCCYAHEDQQIFLKLKKQLAPLLRFQPIDLWYDAYISPGAEWGSEIYKHLNNARVILLLVSPDFMDSEHCYGIEMMRAMERHKRGKARVVPIILRPVHWEQAPFGTLQALPGEARPVTSWHNLDEALFDVVEGINKVIESLCHKPVSEQPSIGLRLAGSAGVLSLSTRPRVTSLSTNPWEWNRYSLAQTLVLHHSEPIASVTLTSDGTALASDGWDNKLLYWKVYPDKAQMERT